MKLKRTYAKLLHSRYGSALLLLSIFIVFSTITRLVLTCISLPRVEYNVINIVAAFGIGLFYDVVAGLFFVALLMLYLWLCPHKLFIQKWHKYVLYVYCIVSMVILVFNSSGEVIFWQEYGNRYDFIAVDYLIYTYEVINNIIESYPVYWILAGVFVVASGLFYFVKKYLYLPTKDTRFVKRSVVFIVYAALCFTNYKLLTNSFRFFSNNAYSNELAANGLYEFGTAYFANSIDYAKKYVTINDTTAFNLLKNNLFTKEATYTTNQLYNLSRVIKADTATKPYNVVLISVESLSASFMQYFGSNKNMTPFMDSLIPNSMFCSNLYATGTRTVRGLEALSLAIPPTPGQSIVRRPNNENMFTIGNLLSSKGYDCRYIYGGNSFFDNMGPYFSSNGYKVVDSRDFTAAETTFTTAWGACDEDIFNKAIKECDASYSNQKLFYNHVMTVSNHRPFTFPKGKITSYNPDNHTREGAVAYTDWAIGNFIHQAQSKPWFVNTIFVIVADHCASAAGKVALPVTGYHIPALIYAPNLVPPSIMNRLMSQIDIIPTLLGIMNINYTSKFMGYNMLQLEPGRERAFISTYTKMGYIKHDTLVILEPKKTAETYKPNFTTGTATLLQPDSGLIKEAISWYQMANYFYKKKLYGK